MAQIEYIKELGDVREVTILSFDSDIALLWYLAELSRPSMDPVDAIIRLVEEEGCVVGVPTNPDSSGRSE